MTRTGLPEVVHLLVPTWGADAARDGHSRALCEALRGVGVRSELFARERIGASGDLHEVAGDGATAGRLRVHSASSLHTGASTDGALLVVRVTPEGWRDPIPGPGGAPVALDCHGFFEPGAVAAWDPGAARRMAATLDELAAVRARTALAVVDSHAAANQLQRAGFHRTAVVPALGAAGQPAEPDPRTLRRLGAQTGAEPATTWVTTGGVHALAGLDRVIAAVWAARRYLGLGVGLHLVGDVEDVHCARALRAFAAELGISSGVRFAGAVTPAEESAYLEVADLVCDLSPAGRPAQGAGAALARGKPVVAVRGGTAHAVVDGAGLVVGAGVPLATARCAERVHGDSGVRQLLADAARLRSAELETHRAGSVWVDLLAQAWAGAA